MTTKLAALVCGFALIAGCASVTPEDLAAALAGVDEHADAAVRTTAEAAQNTANEAQRLANEARQLASGAQSTANQALSAAQDAQACCDATNQRLDRMFEQTVQK